jgi:fatty acid desaturase
MKDSYFYKSLAATLLIYSVIMCALVGFVLAYGVTGVFIIALIVIYFLCYFYGVFGKIKNSGKQDKS